MDLDRIRGELEGMGWVVKSGVLYGTEFMLYRKRSQGHVHAEYLVKVGVRDWREVLAVGRCAGSVGKV
jgi:tRNA splicing endonuclease